MYRLSGVSKILMGIYTILRVDAPTLAHPEHKEDFNDNENNDTTKENLFRFLTYI